MMKKYRLTEKAKARYIALFWLLVVVIGGLANTWLGY